MYEDAICPNCKKPTKRRILYSTTTDTAWYDYIDENGKYHNEDPNVYSYRFLCIECGEEFGVSYRRGKKIEE